MAISMKIGSEEETAAPTAKKEGVQDTVKMQIRKTLDGDVIIYDHEDLDIVISEKKSKVVAFPKSDTDEESYVSQKRLFDFLQKKGVVTRESVQGGSVFNAIEAKIPTPAEEGVSSTQVVIKTISEFIEEERPYFTRKENFEDMEVDRLTDPSAEDSTELGEVPHGEQKGSMRPGLYYAPYLSTYNYFY